MTATANTAAMASGAPGLPSAFVWRDRVVRVAEVLETWKDTGPCHSGSDERYVRKHWFRIRTEAGHEMRIYFERQPRSSRERTHRWWLYSISREALAVFAEGPNGAPDDSAGTHAAG